MTRRDYISDELFVADYTTGYVEFYDKNYRWTDSRGNGAAPEEYLKSDFDDISDGQASCHSWGAVA